MSDDKPFYEPQESDEDPKPKFELYIKASSIDGEMKGSCPICQQWFMIAYLLAEQKNASFKVFTVQANTPPQTFKDKVQSKIFPVVIGTSGKNVNGQDISGIVYDNYDDVEKFFESINFNCPKLKRTQQANIASLKIFEDLYKNFNLFLQNPSSDGKKLLSDLRNLNSHLEMQETPFLTGPSLAYADCVLLPKLQHIRLAGEQYRDFKIPEEFTAIWDYMERGYQTTAFSATLPSDQDIVKHYEMRAAGKGIKGRPTLQKQTYTMSVPKRVPTTTVNGGGDGEGSNGMDESGE